MTPIELKEAIRLHSLWLSEEGGGVRANLEGANLEGANLEGAYLAWANLEGANLAWANLAWANLEGAMRGKGRTFATTPIRITGGQYPALIADGWVEIGCSSWAFEEFATLHAHTGTTNFSEGKALILAAIAYKEALKS